MNVDEVTLGEHFQYLKTLFMNRMNYTWEEVYRRQMDRFGYTLCHTNYNLDIYLYIFTFTLVKQVMSCAKFLPAVEQMHLCFNRISVLECPQYCLHNLTLLNLEGNKIEDWNQLLKLGHLER